MICCKSETKNHLFAVENQGEVSVLHLLVHTLPDIELSLFVSWRRLLSIKHHILTRDLHLGGDNKVFVLEGLFAFGVGKELKDSLVTICLQWVLIVKLIREHICDELTLDTDFVVALVVEKDGHTASVKSIAPIGEDLDGHGSVSDHEGDRLETFARRESPHHLQKVLDHQLSRLLDNPGLAREDCYILHADAARYVCKTQNVGEVVVTHKLDLTREKQTYDITKYGFVLWSLI